MKIERFNEGWRNTITSLVCEIKFNDVTMEYIEDFVKKLKIIQMNYFPFNSARGFCNFYRAPNKTIGFKIEFENNYGIKLFNIYLNPQSEKGLNGICIFTIGTINTGDHGDFFRELNFSANIDEFTKSMDKIKKEYESNSIGNRFDM